MERLSVPPAVQLVQAIYDYQGENNDELCIAKGDVITVTQAPDGGWFEGTLDGISKLALDNACRIASVPFLILSYPFGANKSGLVPQ